MFGKKYRWDWRKYAQIVSNESTFTSVLISHEKDHSFLSTFFYTIHLWPTFLKKITYFFFKEKSKLRNKYYLAIAKTNLMKDYAMLDAWGTVYVAPTIGKIQKYRVPRSVCPNIVISLEEHYFLNFVYFLDRLLYLSFVSGYF